MKHRTASLILLVVSRDQVLRLKDAFSRTMIAYSQPISALCSYATDISLAKTLTLSCIASRSSRALAKSASSLSIRCRAAALDVDSGAVDGLVAGCEAQNLVASDFLSPLRRGAAAAELVGRNEYIEEMSLHASCAGRSSLCRPSSIAHSTSTCMIPVAFTATSQCSKQISRRRFAQQSLRMLSDRGLPQQ